MIKIKKSVHGWIIDLELEKIKKYSGYTMYQVYRIIDGKRKPVYKESFTDVELNELIKKKCIKEEVFV